MNILYIAFSCSPYHGSEDKIGWNIPVESAKTNRVFVLTREEQRRYIENYLKQNPINNLSFLYVDIPDVWKLLFRGPFYSGRLNIYNHKAMGLVHDICAREHIDVIHQITPIEFRSIGRYGSVPNVKFVCGPIAGGQSIPRALEGYLSCKQVAIECLRHIINESSRVWIKCRDRLRKCDYLLFANYETKSFLAQCLSQEQRCEEMTDVSIDRNDLIDKQERNRKHSLNCRFIVVGRLVYLKGHGLLLDALARIPKDLDYVCSIVGEGADKEKLMQKCAALGLNDKVSFTGAVPYEQILNSYDSADVLITPSFREATGSVILEAMARGLPVITINKFGGAMILDEDAGWLYDGNTKEAYVENLKSAIIECITQPEEVRRRGVNARKYAEEHTWQKKVARYQRIYQRILSEKKE